jgi:hypothetical protein
MTVKSRRPMSISNRTARSRVACRSHFDRRSLAMAVVRSLFGRPPDVSVRFTAGTAQFMMRIA